MKKISLLVCVIFLTCMFNGAPIYAEDSIDTQILNNTLEGIEFEKDHNYEDAIRCYSKCIELDPNNVSQLLSRSACYYYLQNYDASVKDLDMVLTLNPKNYEALYDKACICNLTSDKENSMKLLKQVLSMDSKAKKRAVEDKDFSDIKDTDQFRSITGITVRIDGEVRGKG